MQKPFRARFRIGVHGSRPVRDFRIGKNGFISGYPHVFNHMFSIESAVMSDNDQGLPHPRPTDVRAWVRAANAARREPQVNCRDRPPRRPRGGGAGPVSAGPPKLTAVPGLRVGHGWPTRTCLLRSPMFSLSLLAMYFPCFYPILYPAFYRSACLRFSAVTYTKCFYPEFYPSIFCSLELFIP